MKNSTIDRDEARLWLLVRMVIAIILIAFTYYGFFAHQTCDSQNVNLYCKLTGTIFDWIGCIIFYAGALTLAGVPLMISKGAQYLFTPPNGGGLYVALYAGIAIGPILFWNL